MKRLFTIPLLFVSFSLVLASCGLGDAAKKAEKQADKYHRFLKAGNESAMLDMIHKDGMAQDGEAFRDLVTKMATEMKITKIEKSAGFNTSINNGVTKVRLNYIMQDKVHGTITEEIVLQDSKDGVMKIIALNYR